MNAASPIAKRYLLHGIAAALCLFGFYLRLAESNLTFLNPDEAWHFSIAADADWLERSKPVVHPPLPYAMWHMILHFNSSETALRLPIMAASAAFPFLLFLWLQRLFGPATGFCGLLITCFSPILISLGAQMRGYMLCLFFAAAALLCLENAFAASTKRWVAAHMLLFTLALSLGILSEFCMGFFLAAVGVYALIRIFSSPTSTFFRLSWLSSQVLTLLTCAWLYRAYLSSSLRPMNSQNEYISFLDFAFPQPGQSPWSFAFRATTDQFAYALSASSDQLLYLAVPLFLAALFLLLRRSPTHLAAPSLYPALAAALPVGFLLPCAAAWMRIFPYGRTRHSSIVALFVAIVAAIPVGRLASLSPYLASALAIPALLLWPSLSIPDFNNIPSDRQSRQAMLEAIPQLQQALPPDAIVFTEEEAAWLLNYYATPNHTSPQQTRVGRFQQAQYGRLKLVWRRWDIGLANLPKDIEELRSALALPAETPIYILDSGFELNLVAILQEFNNSLPLPEEQNFGDIFTLFRLNEASMDLIRRAKDFPVKNARLIPLSKIR